MAKSPNLEGLLLTEGGNQKYATINDFLLRIEAAFTDWFDVVMTGADKTLSDDEALKHIFFLISGTGGASVDLFVPRESGTVLNKKLYIVKKTATGNVTVKTSAGTGITLTGSDSKLLYCDGTNVIDLSPVAGGGSSVPYTPSSPVQGQMLRYDSGGNLDNEDVPYDVGGAKLGTGFEDETILEFIFPRACTLYATGTGSVASVAVNPSGNTDFLLKKGGSTFGRLRISSGGAASFTDAAGTGAMAAETFVSGNVLSVVAPAALNGLDTIRFTLVLKRD